MCTENKIYSIKEVAEKFQITKNKLRFYENKGIISPRRNANSGYREYTQDDLISIKLILTYRALDVSIEDIKKIISSRNDNKLEDQLFKQLEIVNSLLRKYRLIQNGLEDTMNSYLEDLSVKNLQDSFIDIASEIIDSKNESKWIDLWDFDSFSKSYDKMVSKSEIDGFYKNYDKLLQEVYELASNGLNESAKVLDIGVGTGNLAKLFIDRNISVVGLDQSVKMMIKAKEKLPALKLKYGDFLKLPFEDNLFERIVSTYTFHHLTYEEKELALKEMLRVLKADGEIVIGDITLQENPPEELLDSDEYYTEIPIFIKLVEKYKCKIDVHNIDEYLSIFRIKTIK